MLKLKRIYLLQSVITGFHLIPDMASPPMIRGVVRNCDPVTAVYLIVVSPISHSFSVKFGRKVQYVNYLHELEQHMDLERLPVPKQVIE